MSEPARINAEAQAPLPETPKRNNAPKIPFEYDDEVSRLYEELKDCGKVEKALKELHPGLDCDRYSVLRRVNRLRNERQAVEQSISLRQDAIRAGGEAVVALERLRLQYGDVIEHVVASWEDSNREEAAFDCKVASTLRGAIREHSRMLADAQKALAKADELEEKAEKSRQRRESLEKMDRFEQELRERQAARQSARSTASPTAAAASRDDAAAGQPPPAKPAGVSERMPKAPNAAASPASNEDDEDDFDPHAPAATFSYPPDGAILRKKPEVYSGKGEPNSQVFVTVDRDFTKQVKVDQKGFWRVLGAIVLGLKPGQHQATVTPYTRAGKFGVPASIRFTLLALLFMLLPVRALTNEITLLANSPISLPCGLVRPPFDVLRDPGDADGGPPMPLSGASRQRPISTA